MISKDTVIALANERIEELNAKFVEQDGDAAKTIFLVETSISTASVINLFIDALNGKVAIEDCVSVSRNVEHNLDREVEDFQLSVSSAGMDQPFKVHKQYIKNVGRNVKVNLKEHGGHEGKLIEVTEDKIVLEIETKKKIEGKKKKETVIENCEILFSDIKETKIVISFK